MLNEILEIIGVDFNELVKLVVIGILLPLVKNTLGYLKDTRLIKKEGRYMNQLRESAQIAVKDVYQTIVHKAKNTEVWDDDFKREILEIAKTKTIFNLSTEAYKFLKTVNSDFEYWLESIIESTILDEKHANAIENNDSL